MSIPITVFTGFVGAGKTTTILGLLASLPKGYKTCLLKNEFGDVQVDSQLAKQSNLTAVSEVLNGCLCCVLVGQMKTALLEISGPNIQSVHLEKYSPDRIFIETSGSAFPATLAFQIRELEQETNGAVKLDAIATVVDAENFTGYEDTSPTARMQASYTDIILINKWEHVSERQLDVVMDHLNTLNDRTPKVKCGGESGIDPALIYGLDTKLFSDPLHLAQDGIHNEEVQALTVRRGLSSAHPRSCSCESTDAHSRLDEQAGTDGSVLVEACLFSALAMLPKDIIWRVKGFVRLACTSPTSPRDFIVNWAFGRFELTPRAYADGDWDCSKAAQEPDVLLTVMGERGEMRKFTSRFAKAIGADVV